MCVFFFTRQYVRGALCSAMSHCAFTEISEILLASVFTRRQLREMCSKHPRDTHTTFLCIAILPPPPYTHIRWSPLWESLQWTLNKGNSIDRLVREEVKEVNVSLQLSARPAVWTVWCSVSQVTDMCDRSHVSQGHWLHFPNCTYFWVEWINFPFEKVLLQFSLMFLRLQTEDILVSVNDFEKLTFPVCSET